MRRLLCIFLLMLLPLHGSAMQGGWLSAENVFDIAHEIEHLQAVSHHHDDRSVHYDDSGESAAHSADHSASHAQQAVSLPSAAMPLLALQSFTVRLRELAYYIPDPFLGNPQRPPSRPG